MTWMNKLEMNRHYDKKMNQNDRQVTLNIGGKLFQTRLSTLTRDPTHFFARITSDEWSYRDNCPIFVDRNPDQFSYILDYLRKGKVNLPPEKHFVYDINDEAEYYGIIGLQDLIREHLLEEKTKQYDEDISKRDKRSGSVVSGNGTPTNVSTHPLLPILPKGSPFRCTQLLNEPVTPNKLEEEAKRVKFQLHHTMSAPIGFETNKRESPTPMNSGSQTHSHSHTHHTLTLPSMNFPMPFTPIVEPPIDFEADRRALVNDDPSPPSSCCGNVQDLGEPIFHTDEDF